MLVVINKDSLMRGGLCGRGDAMGALGGHAPGPCPLLEPGALPNERGTAVEKLADSGLGQSVSS